MTGTLNIYKASGYKIRNRNRAKYMMGWHVLEKKLQECKKLYFSTIPLQV